MTSLAPRIMAILRSAISVSLFAVLLAAACQPTGQSFQVTLRTEFSDPLPVTLTDETGLVTGITQATFGPAAGNAPALHGDPADPNASILTWVGGMCDSDTAVVFRMLHGSYVLNVSIHQRFGLGCPAAGVPRAIRIGTSRPIPVDSITVAGG